MTSMDNAAQRAVPNPSVPWTPLPRAENFDDVMRNLDQVIDWAIKADSTIGYFAVLYRRSTLACRAAIRRGEFHDADLMHRFGAVFAQRYFDALNAYFRPGEDEGLTLPWEVVFCGQELGHSTMLQHMVAGLNAHIQFDLGVVTAEMVPTALQTFEEDFLRINDLVASQVGDMLRVVDELSPTVRRLRWVMPPRQKLIARVLRKFRRSCWLFAIYLALNPHKAREQTVNQMAWSSALCGWYLHPPEYWRLTPTIIRAISKRESRDTAANLKALNVVPDELLNPPTS